MPAPRTAITEIGTALGMLCSSLDTAFAARPPELFHVPDETWSGLGEAWSTGHDRQLFEMAFNNGQAFLTAADGLRGRRPTRVEWKGQHRPPGDDVIPADLRIDHVFLVSCKYLSAITVNAGPVRLFDRLLIGDQRDGTNWFAQVATVEFEAFYRSAVVATGLTNLPPSVSELTSADQDRLREHLRGRTLPDGMLDSWQALCHAVSNRTAERWTDSLGTGRDQLKLLWKMLRISAATYFVLGTAPDAYLRLRIDSAWDWTQAYELRAFQVEAGTVGQPQVQWTAIIRRRDDGSDRSVKGHVEIRWSHGRFRGPPEAKIYLDTPHREVPGYNRLR